jgi:hypothetical protein
MITAETLAKVTQFSRNDLAKILDTSGYTKCSFKSARFLGITNGGQFCYQVTYHDDHTGEDAVGKVFVTYNSANNSTTADF